MDWVEKAHKILSGDKDMVMKSFDVCGITTTNPLKVRSGDFYETCMSKANSLLLQEEEEAALDDPFDL